jgi:hypothetical protein
MQACKKIDRQSDRQTGMKTDCQIGRHTAHRLRDADNLTESHRGIWKNRRQTLGDAQR